MNSKIIANGILRAVAILTGIALLIVFLYKIGIVLTYIAIAFVVSLIGRPMVLFLRRRIKFSNTLAVVFTMILMVALLLGVISLFIPLVIEQGENLSLLDIDALQINIKNLYYEISDYFNITQKDIEAEIKDTIKEAGWFGNIDFSAIPDFLNSIVAFLGNFSAGLFSVLFISFFFLKDSRLFMDGIKIFIPDSKENQLSASFDKIKDLLSRYFLGLIIQILILFVIYTTVLLIVGIENAIVIAFLCALLNIIPYIGPLIGGALMILLVMTSNLGADFSTFILPKTLYVFLGFVIGQLIDNFFSQPFIFSNSVKSHPLEIFLIIIIAGILFGVVGMIIAVPGYTVVKVILKEFISDNKIVRSLTRRL
ncbi:AI-2E family transporter [Ascidiimonas sp. W6]|uniref:AI-2E family transporter n=1 Tax=Ascidiimonas meishanensis TaxID=3128903 RepID=UPI0030EDF699